MFGRSCNGFGEEREQQVRYTCRASHVILAPLTVSSISTLFFLACQRLLRLPHQRRSSSGALRTMPLRIGMHMCSPLVRSPMFSPVHDVIISLCHAMYRRGAFTPSQVSTALLQSIRQSDELNPPLRCGPAERSVRSDIAPHTP